MADPTTWKDIGLEVAKGFPQTIVAFGGLVWAFRRYVKPSIERIDKKQDRMTAQLDGHEKMLRKATRAQGRLEGFVKAKREAHNDLDRAVKTVKTAAKRGRRRSTDK